MEWLRFQVEIERLAAVAACRHASRPPAWVVYGYPQPGVMISRDIDGQPVVFKGDGPSETEAAHIALHGPRDAIADCEAKLAIIDRCAELADRVELGEGVHDGRDWDELERDEALADEANEFLSLIAESYKHRDGWAEHWACPGCGVSFREVPVGHSWAIPMTGGPWTCSDPVKAAPVAELRLYEPIAPGSRLTVWQPEGAVPFGPGPYAAGQGFTLKGNDGLWRAILQSWDETPEGVTLEMQVEGRYPATSAQAVATPG